MYFRENKLPFDSMHEECGVFGIYSKEKRDVANTVYYGLFSLQHRGQESAGIAVCSDDRIEYHKGMGLVPEVFNMATLASLPEGDIAIGHVRYSTTGESQPVNSQPLVFTGKHGKMAVAHNGNIVNTEQLRKKLIDKNVIFQTTIDSEIIAAMINCYSDDNEVDGIIKAAKELKGSFALVIMSSNKLIAVRDNNGIRPLVLGKLDDEFVVASETCALDAIKATYIRDVKPGEILVIDCNGLKSYFMDNCGSASCIFEYVYFARPDSNIDGCSVYESRYLAGKLLAKNFPVEADIVCGVPDSALVSARGYSVESGIPYVEALAKNRYVGRTFIQPDQGIRESSVSVKLNAIRRNVEGKRVVLIDDSIVRGTTSRKIVKMVREAGAKEVHLRISSPIVKHPCFLGVDMQTYSQLLGAKRTDDEIRDYLGADSVKFLSIEMLEQTVATADCKFCKGCFDGKYPVALDKEEFAKMQLE